MFFETGLLHYTNQTAHSPNVISSKMQSVEFGEKFVSTMCPLHFGKYFEVVHKRFIELTAGASLGYNCFFFEHAISSYFNNSVYQIEDDTISNFTPTNITDAKVKFMEV